MVGLAGKRVALLAANGSEQAEVTVIRKVLAEAGAMPVIVSPKKHELRLWSGIDWGDSLVVDAAVGTVEAGDFDAMIAIGGVLAADTLRADREVVRLVRDALGLARPVGAMGHAVWVLIEAGAVAGRIVTSIESIRTDVINAAGSWADDPAVNDRHVVTGRHRHDLPDFMAAMAEEMARD
ncbi:MAG TPA: hypothetical protein HPQ04_03855 [Rhodospirillaceae bacterium]|nr:hypothetical protein [Rhodospirillaceae bacterium]